MFETQNSLPAFRTVFNGILHTSLVLLTLLLNLMHKDESWSLFVSPILMNPSSVRWYFVFSLSSVRASFSA